MLKLANLIILLTTLFAFIAINTQPLYAANKFKILHIEFGNKDICAADPSGPFDTLSACKNALEDQQHPGKFKIVNLFNSDKCLPDPNGPYTYSQCQDELINLQHPGQFKIEQVEIFGESIDKCVADAGGPYTYSQCQDAISDQKSAEEKPTGENPCKSGICETGLGDISTNPQAFASKILTIAIGIAGGIALILMVFGSIRVLTSSGDQQKLSGGRDTIVAAVAGLLFLIFSVLILRFIGIQILGL